VSVITVDGLPLRGLSSMLVSPSLTFFIHLCTLLLSMVSSVGFCGCRIACTLPSSRIQWWHVASAWNPLLTCNKEYYNRKRKSYSTNTCNLNDLCQLMRSYAHFCIISVQPTY
jgi:hypothetical protein